MAPSAHSPTAKSTSRPTGRESSLAITRSRLPTAEAWARSGFEQFRMGEEKFGYRQSTLLSARRSWKSLLGLRKPCSIGAPWILMRNSNSVKLTNFKTFFAVALVCSAVLVALAGAPSAIAAEVVLQDSKVLVAFDSGSGALTRLEDKTSHWVIERRSELGVPFRLHAPLPDRRDNFVLGEKQRATEVTKISDRQVRLVWKNLASEHGGILPITLSATVTLNDGALTF